MDRDEQGHVGAEQGGRSSKGVELVALDVHLDDAWSGDALLSNDLCQGHERDLVGSDTHLIGERITSAPERHGAGLRSDGSVHDANIADLIPAYVMLEEPEIRTSGLDCHDRALGTDHSGRGQGHEPLVGAEIEEALAPTDNGLERPEPVAPEGAGSVPPARAGDTPLEATVYAGANRDPHAAEEALTE